MTLTRDSDSTEPKTCQYSALLCLQWILWIPLWPNLVPDLTGLYVPQIRIQLAQKHVNTLVYFVCNGFSGFDLCTILILTWLGQMNLRFGFIGPKSMWICWLCLQWVSGSHPLPDLDSVLAGSNGPQIWIQRAQKHKVHVVWSTARDTFCGPALLISSKYFCDLILSRDHILRCRYCFLKYEVSNSYAVKKLSISENLVLH